MVILLTKSGINSDIQLLINSMPDSIQFEFPIIDLRASESFARLHLIHSANIPADELHDRTHELPDKSISINLVGDLKQLDSATSLLESKGYSICATLFITHQILIESFSQSKLTTGLEFKRYWKPASVVEWFCQNVVAQGDSKRGLDLACGAGRDSIFLALKGWQMTSVDSSEHALARVNGSAVRANLKVDCIRMDIEKEIHELTALGRNFDLIVVVRYLHRPLLSLLPKLLNDSGYIVYQTFMQGCEKFGSPKNPRFLLQKNELATTFSGFKILLDEIEYLTDGRPVNSFIAQKIVK